MSGEFRLRHGSATTEKAAQAAARVEAIVGEVVNGNRRAWGRIIVEDMALLVQHTRDAAASPDWLRKMAIDTLAARWETAKAERDAAVARAEAAEFKLRRFLPAEGGRRCGSIPPCANCCRDSSGAKCTTPKETQQAKVAEAETWADLYSRAKVAEAKLAALSLACAHCGPESAGPAGDSPMACATCYGTLILTDAAGAAELQRRYDDAVSAGVGERTEVSDG